MQGPTFAYRFCSITLCLSVGMLGFPAFAFAPSPESPTSVIAEVEQPKAVSRSLDEKEMAGLKGAYGRNPYVAGSAKWNPVYKGVDLFTGNFSTSVTDLSFEGGYGIPVNITRAYSSNAYEEGPFGSGWSLSADVRTTAGGLLKSAAAPARAVPVNFKERPSAQVDPNLATGSQPPAAVIAEDSSGKSETIQRDVDGVLTTPPWDKNKIDSEYETVELSGAKYEIIKKNTVTTPEGTVYVYEKKGYYDGGAVPYGTSGSAEPSNILKITSVADRHGNTTTYTYGTTYYDFAKRNGTAKEYLLTGVAMPNGHTISLTWGDVNTGGGVAMRVTQVSDGTRNVGYAYDGSFRLSTVTTPGGKVTTYGYGAAGYPSGNQPAELPLDLLTSIKDCRGLTTTLTYHMLQVFVMPHGIGLGSGSETPCVIKMVAPNGFETYFGHYNHSGGGVYNNLHHSTPQILGEFYEADPNNVDATWNSANIKCRVVSGTKLEQYCIFRDPDGDLRQIVWKKVFDLVTQDLEEQTTFSEPITWFDDTMGTDYFPAASTFCKAVRTESDYNFMGNPLRQKTYEYGSVSISSVGYHDYSSWPSINLGTSSRNSEVSYSYWGADKYWQQKAIRSGPSSSYRYSYTDYYDSAAATGSKGQVYKVYDDKRTVFAMNSDSVGGAAEDDYWRYRLYPTLQSSLSTHSAKFEYDAKGRSVDVWKIQKTPNLTSPSGWTYVQTRTNYGSDGSSSWGMASSVVEDYGTSKINRTTTTNSYDFSGRATSVTNADSRTFETTFNNDGQVSLVKRTDCNPDVEIFAYSYGATAPSGGSIVGSYGMVTQVKDRADYVVDPGGTITYNDVTQNFTYNNSGLAVGQVSQVEEVRTGTTYSSTYEYNGYGERVKSTRTTPNGTVRWHYGHYETIGDPLGGTRAYQRMTKLDSSSNATGEESHYYYDSQGKVLYSAFAQDPDDWGPSGGNSYYDSAHHADYRCLASYAYDEAGRLGSLGYIWQTWVPSGETGSYSDTGYVGKSEYDYELSGLERGIRTDVRLYGPNSGNTAFEQTRSEHYEYDGDVDYLIAARYNDDTTSGYEKENEWLYDAAGNRISEMHDSLTTSPTTSTDYAYDNLNRITQSPKWTGTAFSSDDFYYENDIRGNRTQRGDWYTNDGNYASYMWNDVNLTCPQFESHLVLRHLRVLCIV